MQGNNRNRSRSPVRVDNIGRRRDNKMDGTKNSNTGVAHASDMSMMSQMMNQMSQYGNMMMGGMYPNMMMPGTMMGGSMIPTGSGMEMMSSSGMEMMNQNIDMSAMAAGAMATPMATSMATTIAAAPIPAPPLPPSAATMDMSMMGGMGGMMMDPSMMGMYQGMGTDMTAMEGRKEIVLKHCKLTPPDPGTPQPPRRSRPPGCRTIFVGGLPDKIRESVVREIFENYGRIHTLRLSKKNFCHIRFDRESCVDAAMAISGYRIKLTDVKEKEKDKDDMDEDDDSHATTGWLHVDYAASRDDQNEFERRQRQAIRIQQQQMQQMNTHQEMPTRAVAPVYRRSPSPVRVQPYSNTAVIQLSEKVKNEEHFASALPTLLAWLERGECSKKNANQFYSMIQATNSHIRRLFNEKMQSEEELQECKERIRLNIENVINQLEQVAKVFSAAAHQRVWDHFTKPQRKNIETWQKMTQEFSSLREEFNEKFYGAEENDFNNGLNNRPLDMDTTGSASSEEVNQLKRENESLRFQLEAYKNEVDVIKSDAKKEMEKFKAQFIARQALQGAMQASGDQKPPLPSNTPLKPPPPPPLPDDNKVNIAETIGADCGEAKLIGVMSAFLQVHPQGASLDYVVSYVRGLFPQVSQASVHHVLQKHTDVFQRNTSGVGANIENRWSFAAFLKRETA